MKFSALLLTTVAVAAPALAAPAASPSSPLSARQLQCPSNSGKGCGSYQVSGLGARKQQIYNAGGGTWEVAIAMMETERLDTNYAYGDNKRDDSSNFGIFKQVRRTSIPAQIECELS